MTQLDDSENKSGSCDPSDISNVRKRVLSDHSVCADSQSMFPPGFKTKPFAGLKRRPNFNKNSLR